MAHLKLYILLWSFLIVSIFASTRRSFKNVDQNQNTDVIANSIMQLAVDISKNIKTSSAKNEIFSPISIAGALSLLLLGARGQTENELLEALHLKNVDRPHELIGKLLDDLVSNNVIHQPLWHTENKCFDDEEEDDEDEDEESKNFKSHLVSISNGIFIQNDFTIKDDYRQNVKTFYKNNVQSLDFKQNPTGSVNFINKWVDHNTNGRIPEILSEGLDSTTRMIVASSLYFKAFWKQHFIDGATKKRDFFPDGTSSPKTAIKVDMMANGGCFPYHDYPQKQVKIMGFPYEKDVSTMYIILPYNSSKSVLNSLDITAQDITSMISQMKKRNSIILFPKLHLSNTLNLKGILRFLGVKTLFVPHSCNLSGISDVKLPKDDGTDKKKPQKTAKPDYNNLFEYLVIRTDPVNPKLSDTKTCEFYDENVVTKDETKENCYDIIGKDAINKRNKRALKRKAESSDSSKNYKSFKDFLARKIIYKKNGEKKSKRIRRESKNAGLYAENIVHKIDLEINETGTEGGAATAISLNRSGSNVVFRVDTPFLLMIMNDSTKTPIFYGKVYSPI